MRSVEDVASLIANATVFSSLLTTFNAPFGRYRFLRIPFGNTSASEVFHPEMEELFPGYICAITVDDLLVWVEVKSGT